MGLFLLFFSCFVLGIGIGAEILQIKLDPDGRFIVLIRQIASVTLTLVNVCLYPPSDFHRWANQIVTYAFIQTSWPPALCGRL